MNSADITSTLRHEARSLIRSLTGAKGYTDSRHHLALDFEINALRYAIGEHKHNPTLETFSFLQTCHSDGVKALCSATGAHM